MRKRLIVCVSITKQNVKHVKIFKEFLNSLFLFSDPNKFSLLLLLDNDTVAPVMRLHIIDSFYYIVKLNAIEENIDTLLEYERVIILPFNMLVQGDIKQIMQFKLEKNVLYIDSKQKILMCKPFRKMFSKDTKVRNELVENSLQYVKKIHDCFNNKLFLLFDKESTQRKFIKHYFDRLMLNKCA